LPLYTLEEARQCLQYFEPIPFEVSKQLHPGLAFRYVRSAHILGASMAEITVQQNGGVRRLLFTGDLGRVQDETIAPGKVVHHTPQEGESADVLVMESTYGNRLHPKADPRPELARLVREAVGRGGSIVVPAFAVERTQKFLFMLKELMEERQIPRLPVFADSPMAIQAVKIFLQHAEEFNERARALIGKWGSPLSWEGFHFCTMAAESKKINDTKYPCIIVSANGMCTGGRIQHHLLHRLADPRNLILFIGFQAPGTRGAQIKDGEKQVKIFGEIVTVRAHTAALEQFSDHADTPEMLQWLHTFAHAPQSTWLVHGEPASAQMLRQAVTSALQWNVEIGQYLQKVPV
jgi:metallo-beta-lactamase family protein